MKKIFVFTAFLIISIFTFRTETIGQYNIRDDHGYSMLIEMGGMTETSNDTLKTMRLSMINGYQFTPHLMLGAGIGMDIIERGYKMFPIFIDLRGIFGQTRLKGMAFAEFGYGIVPEFSNHTIGNIGIGGLYYLNNEYALSFSLGYENQSIIDAVLHRPDLNYIQIKIGIKGG